MCEEGVWLRQKMQPLTFGMKGKANEKMFFLKEDANTAFVNFRWVLHL